jgi:PAS domain S-box-containing protein
MYASTALTDRVLATAVEAARSGVDALCAALEELSAPLYVTDAEGVVIYYNQACIRFTGRTPTVGKDRWCVTWRLFTDGGQFLPHEECPMAVSVKEQRTVRGLTAVAERPDGTRVNFIPFPTPIFGQAGEFIGSVNMLIDITELRQAMELRAQAGKARRIAGFLADRTAIEALNAVAAECETKAAELEERGRSAYLRLRR